jgi:hypothetical protein
MVYIFYCHFVCTYIYIFYGHLVYFVVIWVYFFSFGTLCQAQSGIPVTVGTFFSVHLLFGCLDVEGIHASVSLAETGSSKWRISHQKKGFRSKAMH